MDVGIKMHLHVESSRDTQTHEINGVDRSVVDSRSIANKNQVGFFYLRVGCFFLDFCKQRLVLQVPALPALLVPRSVRRCPFLALWILEQSGYFLAGGNLLALDSLEHDPAPRHTYSATSHCASWVLTQGLQEWSCRSTKRLNSTFGLGALWSNLLPAHPQGCACWLVHPRQLLLRLQLPLFSVSKVHSFSSLFLQHLFRSHPSSWMHLRMASSRSVPHEKLQAAMLWLELPLGVA